MVLVRLESGLMVWLFPLAAIVLFEISSGCLTKRALRIFLNVTINSNPRRLPDSFIIYIVAPHSHKSLGLIGH